MPIIPKNKNTRRTLITISILLNFIAILFVFTPLKLQTKRQHDQSFFPNNVKVTNTLIKLVEQKNLAITPAELVSAIDSNGDSSNLFTADKKNTIATQNNYGKLRFSVNEKTGLINKIWIEIPKELPIDRY